jgi:glutamate dehydrogenase
MTASADGQAVVDAVVALGNRSGGEDSDPLVPGFLRRYYERVAPDELAGRPPPDLFGAAMAHWRAGAVRSAGAAVVHVYNPTVATDGWQVERTVVDIVTDDMPFLVDSVTMALAARQLDIHVVVHPMLGVARDAGGRVDAVGDGHPREAWIHLEVDLQRSPEERAGLETALRSTLADVRLAVGDWMQMRERCLAVADEVDRGVPVDAAEAQDTVGLLRWMAADNFTFLGYRDYELAVEDGEPVLRGVPGTGRGILRDANRPPRSQPFSTLPAAVRDRIHERRLLVVTRANSRSTVHRPDYFAYVSVKRFGPDGAVVGEHRFIGLWGAGAYRSDARDIPFVRRKVLAVEARSGVPPDSHSGRALHNILETYPRDELFQTDVDELFTIASGILNLQERRTVRLFARHDAYGRFVSCLIYVPRDRYSTTIVERMEQVLLDAYHGQSAEYGSSISSSVLARLHVLVFVGPEGAADVDEREVERRLAALTRWWIDDLRDALASSLGEEEGLAVAARCGDAFPASYREAFDPSVAVRDLTRIALLDDSGRIVTALYDGPADDRRVRLKIYSRAELSLSSVLPVLEQMGVTVTDERPYEITPRGGPPAWVYDFGLELPAGVVVDDRVRDEFLATFGAVWRGELESDGFNRLVLRAGLTADQLTVLRAYDRYLRQIGAAFSRDYVEATFAAHPDIARQLADLFAVRFDPHLDGNRNLESEGIATEISAGLDRVTSLDEDRILRSFLRLIMATTRTNAFLPDRRARRLAFKFDPAKVPDLPLPRPVHEIWVYSPRVEGVHLRAGAVARGGIRWSDRREDFRTEVLDLMKAQKVKNAVIVPTGAKGGFVVKRPPSDPEALRAEVVQCYTAFISGLLDVTDNLVHGEVVPPPDVVRYDGYDPYLVIAADKGTATFSDVANGIAKEAGYWLGDAFASGGSEGYDHKRMGITARGAWESVRRHFRILGRDADTAELTVIGIGDMSGDVFGNGLLRSQHVKLVAAFDHRHVFLDPDPDPAVAWQERARLFELPRSSWDDYDRTKISAGGGVWSRHVKAVPLSEAVRSRLGVGAVALTPNELIGAILRAPVDLLWNGGIGTYVKASSESNADVGDRANDAVRVDGTDLRVAVVAEGGNLGLTQLGRVEYALAGGHVYTDSIDNSAGVDTSDHEVNIKILLDAAVAAGAITEHERHDALHATTEDVAELVLADNRAQALALAVARIQAFDMVDVHARYLRTLEHEGRLSRSLEHLPTDEQLTDREAAGGGLTTPEFAVLLSYTKLDLVDATLASALPEDPYVQSVMAAYFPAELRSRFEPFMEHHRLRREIIATRVVNRMVNKAGMTFEFRMGEETGAAPPDTIRSHLAARDVFGMDDQWAALAELDGVVPAETQLRLLLDLRRMVERGVLWLLRHRRPPLEVQATVAAFQPGVERLAGSLEDVIGSPFGAALAEATKTAIDAGVPAELAARAAAWPYLHTAFDVIEVARARGRTPEDAARVYWGLFERLDLAWIWERVGALPRKDRWQTQARAALRDDLLGEMRTLADDALRAGDVFTPVGAVLEAWMAANERAVARTAQLLEQIRSGGVYDLTTLSVALQQLRNLVLSSSPT